jgi:hypothetical protein
VSQKVDQPVNWPETTSGIFHGHSPAAKGR